MVGVGLGLLDDLLRGGDGRFANSIVDFLVASFAIGERVCPQAHGGKFAPRLSGESICSVPMYSAPCARKYLL